MYYLGIDIGKNTHVASLMDEKAKIIFKAFSFHNSTEGATSLSDSYLFFISIVIIFFHIKSFFYEEFIIYF